MSAMDTLINTVRLRIQPLTADDAPALMSVYGDAEAMRYVGDGKPLTSEQADKWLQVTFDNYQRYGYGMFKIVRHGGELVGFIGIVHPKQQLEPELKYALMANAWGFGFATEAAQGLLAYAAEQWQLTEVIATLNPANDKSQRVLGKCGFTVERQWQDDDGEAVLLMRTSLPKSGD